MNTQVFFKKRFFRTTGMGFLAALLLHVQTPVQAQHATAFFLQGEQLFHEKKYYEAAQCYERYLAAEKKSKPRAIPLAPEKKVKGKTNFSMHQEAVYHLAESYRMYNNYTGAEKCYREATSFSEKAYPESRYWFAVCLRANGKFTEAVGAIDTFLQRYTAMGPVMVAADREQENLKFITAQMTARDTGYFISGPWQQPGSTSSYAMSVRAEDTLVFTSVYGDSSREKDGAMQYTYSSQLFESASTANPLQKARLISESKTGIHNGLATFSKNGKKMFFTQWIKQPGGNNSAIYVREYTGKAWSEPVKMDEPVNLKGYNSAQPFITGDGRYLLFASDRPGGAGGYDLWYAALDSNFNTLSVQNMGTVINTAADEASPFYHNSSRTLIFASNGRIGMGGFDIYSAKGSPDFTYWEKPENPGVPVNSVKDDLYYTSTDEINLWNTGWLSSDRASDCCLSLFSVEQNSHQQIAGRIVDCSNGRPLADADVTIKDRRHGGKQLAVAKTDSAGEYAFQLKNSSGVTILAAKPGYAGKDSSFVIYIKNRYDTLSVKDICLVPVADSVNKAVVDLLKSLSKSSTIGNFLYMKASLNSLAYTNLDSLAAIMTLYPHLKIQIAGYTDGNGTPAYNLRLAQARVNVCIAYLVKKGISPARLLGKAMGECCPVEPEWADGKDNPAARAKNRRVEYTVIEESSDK